MQVLEGFEHQPGQARSKACPVFLRADFFATNEHKIETTDDADFHGNKVIELFPDNAVEYFVSYYDYYQPEAYIPQRDIYIEKDASRNDELDRLRLSATASLTSQHRCGLFAGLRCLFFLSVCHIVGPQGFKGSACQPAENRILIVPFACGSVDSVYNARAAVGFQP